MAKKKKIFFQLFIIFVALAPAMYSILTWNVLNDWYWHSEIGRYICENGLPKIGVFSWYAENNNLPWTAHEWLSEVIMWVLLKDSETKALIFGKIEAILFIVISGYFISKDCEKHIGQSTALMMIISLCSCMYTYTRPHVFSYFFLIATVYLCKRTMEKDDNSVLFLPIIAILWANMHGGSSNIVYVIPLIYGLFSVLPFKIFNINFCNEEHKKSAIKNIIAGVLTIPALMINPYGYHILAYPYSNMGDEVMLRYITEWSVPNVNDFYGALMFSTIIFIIFALINRKKKEIVAGDLILFLFGTFLFIKAARFFPYYAIIICFVLPKYMPNEYAYNPEEKIDFRVKTILITFVTFLFIGLTTLGIMEVVEKGFSASDKYISDEMIEKIEEYNPQKMYNHFNLGAYLIHKHVPVFIDGRADMYTGNAFDDFIAINTKTLAYEPEKTFESYIDKYKFDSFLCLKTEYFNTYFKYNKDKYKVYYEDEDTVFYVPIDKIN